METMDKKGKPPKAPRRNNEKRKEKSRDAARCRRSKETEIFNDLGSELPLGSEQISQLDKASVMRLAISYLKVRDMINLVPILPTKDTDLKSMPQLKDESIFTKTLDGFVLVLSTEGDFIYLSENVSDYLGITQVDLMGQNIFDYSHPCDHEEIKEILHSKTAKDDEDEAPKSAFIRMKCTLTSKGRSVNLKSATYKVIHCMGHMIYDPLKHEEPPKCNKLQSVLVAVGQPIPHPSNIDTPLPAKQTFLTKHNLDMKITDADDQLMMDVLGYTSKDLIDKSVYEYHHALDSESIGASFKCLFSKGQCETNRYRFLAKIGGYCWVVTQATLIYDKMQKPQSVVCVNHVISGVEQPNEIYALHQLIAAKQKVLPSAKVVPEIRVVRVDFVKKELGQLTLANVDTEDKNKLLIKPGSFVPNDKLLTVCAPQKSIAVPVSTTEKLFSSKPIPENIFEPPNIGCVSATEKLFANKSTLQQPSTPRLPTVSKVALPKDSVRNGAKPPEILICPQTKTKQPVSVPTTSEEMNKSFIPGTELLMKADPEEDLTHLAPDAGEAIMELGPNPFIINDIDLFLDVPLLSDDPSGPFNSYRDYSRDGSPQLLSPNLSSKSPDYNSLPSLSAGSPNGSLSDEDCPMSFINLQMEDDCYDNLTDLKSPYISSEDLPLYMPSNDLLWSNSNDKWGNIDQKNVDNNSRLADLLSGVNNKHSIKQQSDHGGGTIHGLEGRLLDVASHNNQSHPWSTKPQIKKEIESPIMSRQGTPTLERTQSIKRQTSPNCYNDHSSKRSRQEPKSTELLHQLMSNNHPNKRGRSKGQAMCVTQPSDSVLMNLLPQSPRSRTSSPGISINSRTSSPCLMDTSSMDSPIGSSQNSAASSRSQTPHNLASFINSGIYKNYNGTMASLRVPPTHLFETQEKIQEEKRIRARKISACLVQPNGIMPLAELTHQDCEVNAPVNSLLFNDELLWTLDHANINLKI